MEIVCRKIPATAGAGSNDVNPIRWNGGTTQSASYKRGSVRLAGGGSLLSLKVYYRKLRTFKGTVKALINLRRLPVQVEDVPDAANESVPIKGCDGLLKLTNDNEVLQAVQSHAKTLVEQGHVVTETYRAEDSSITYQKQGNLDHYTEENLRKRVKLQEHSLMIALTQRLWRCAVEDKGDAMSFADYEAYMLRLHRLILPDFDLTQSKNLIKEDWMRDTANSDHLSYRFFHLSMFELVDLWTDTVDAEDYISLLYCIMHCLTYEWNNDHLLKPLQDIAPVDILETSKKFSQEHIEQDLSREVNSDDTELYRACATEKGVDNASDTHTNHGKEAGEMTQSLGTPHRNESLDVRKHEPIPQRTGSAQSPRRPTSRKAGKYPVHSQNQTAGVIQASTAHGQRVNTIRGSAHHLQSPNTSRVHAIQDQEVSSGHLSTECSQGMVDTVDRPNSRTVVSGSSLGEPLAWNRNGVRYGSMTEIFNISGAHSFQSGSQQKDDAAMRLPFRQEASSGHDNTRHGSAINISSFSKGNDEFIRTTSRPSTAVRPSQAPPATNTSHTASSVKIGISIDNRKGSTYGTKALMSVPRAGTRHLHDEKMSPADGDAMLGITSLGSVHRHTSSRAMPSTFKENESRPSATTTGAEPWPVSDQLTAHAQVSILGVNEDNLSPRSRSMRDRQLHRTSQLSTNTNASSVCISLDKGKTTSEDHHIPVLDMKLSISSTRIGNTGLSPTKSHARGSLMVPNQRPGTSSGSGPAAHYLHARGYPVQDSTTGKQSWPSSPISRGLGVMREREGGHARVDTCSLDLSLGIRPQSSHVPLSVSSVSSTSRHVAASITSRHQSMHATIPSSTPSRDTVTLEIGATRVPLPRRATMLGKANNKRYTTKDVRTKDPPGSLLELLSRSISPRKPVEPVANTRES